VSTLKTKITEAKESAESVTSSESYKKTHSTLSPPVVAVATPKKSSEIKKEEKAEAKEEKKEAKEEKKEEKAEAKEEKKEEKKEIKEEKKEEKKEIKEEKKAEKARKSRSASRKRNSIFGSIGFGKKEEKPETKEETAVAPVAADETTVSRLHFYLCSQLIMFIARCRAYST
jgi:cobalamin biosynthesis protein CobT